MAQTRTVTLETQMEPKYCFATNPAEEYRLKIGKILAKKWFSSFRDRALR